jgi:hypothetical protein
LKVDARCNKRLLQYLVEDRLTFFKESGMWKEFKEFALRGNVIDLAVGVIIGAAFGKIVTALVNDIIMPLVGIFMGGINFSELTFTIGNAVLAVSPPSRSKLRAVRTVHQSCKIILELLLPDAFPSHAGCRLPTMRL